MKEFRPTAFAVVVVLAVAAPMAGGATEMHDNKLIFYVGKGSSGFSSFAYTDISYYITWGQPWDGTASYISDDDKTALLIVHAGRKNSEAVANWFKLKVGQSGRARTSPYHGAWPDKLHFALAGTLTIKLKTPQGDTADIRCTDIVIGQGSRASIDNWWLGGPHLKEAPHSSLAQTCSAGATPINVEFKIYTDSFQISLPSSK